MSRKDQILDLVVKTIPFYHIRGGFKLEEYRKDKPGNELWARRLLSAPTLASLEREGLFPDELCHRRQGGDLVSFFHPYHTARFSLGYAADRPSFLRPIKRIRWGLPNPAWTYGIVTGDPCFIIELEAP